MKNDFEKMTERALEINNRYKKIEPKEWKLEQDLMGLVKDVGELSEKLMIFEGYRKGFDGKIKESIGHELSDVLFSVMVIADKTGIDLEKSFWKTMNEVKERIEDKKLKG
jgi:NTP pyrophosphatase (non-canonical NTP hydrolase)